MQPQSIIYPPPDQLAKFSTRFWAKVDMSGGPDACWPWLGAITGSGYGSFAYRGKSLVAHRVAWLLTYEALPPERCTCHRCDNRPCCNPFHLFSGTYVDNVRDCMAKGRRAPVRRGEDNPDAKLTEAIVQVIRQRYADRDANIMELAGEYGVCFQEISRVIRCKRWAHVPTSLPRESDRRAKLTPQLAADMRAVYRAGVLSRGELARRYDVSKSTVRRVVRGESWALS